MGREAGRIPGLPLTVLPHLGGTSGLKEMTTLTPPQKPQDFGMSLYVFTNSLKLARGTVADSWVSLCELVSCAVWGPRFSLNTGSTVALTNLQLSPSFCVPTFVGSVCTLGNVFADCVLQSNAC